MGVRLDSPKRRRHHRSRLMSEINVTPFVDVMLVLLVVFMVAAPLLTAGVPVNLPQSNANALPTDADGPLIVTLTAEGGIVLEDTPVTRDQLIGALQTAAADRTDPKVFLKAEGSLSYEAVVQVMTDLSLGGFPDIGLLTEAPSPNSEPNQSEGE